MRAENIIKQYAMEPLAWEGGWFQRIFTHPQKHDDRPMTTVIHYLITSYDFSAMHRLKTATEIFCYHSGDPVEMLQIGNEGGQRVELGRRIEAGREPVTIVQPGTWQGMRLVPGQISRGYALMTVTCSPGFQWSDFELGSRLELIKKYPQWNALIVALTKPASKTRHG